ncbi:MAG: FkbM family methyltransferase [Parvicella sp.]|jgi:FkbM family methyltransferase
MGSHIFRRQGYFASGFDYSTTGHEAYMVEVFSHCLDSNPGAFIDVGVNLGQTLTKILGIDANREYIGFEPQIACSFNVEQFLRLNNLNNAQVLPIALSDSNEMLKIYSQGQFDEMASLRTNSQSDPDLTRVSYVQSRIGDDVFEELKIGKICAIKIDVEGAELRVLRGMKETLRKKAQAIIFEVLPNFSGITNRKMNPTEDCFANQIMADSIYSLLTNYGYDIFQIENQSRERKTSRFELNDMTGFVGSNYIALASIDS